MTKDGSRKRSCWVPTLWLAGLVLALILVVLVIAGTLFDLGIWQEFWEWIGRPTGLLVPVVFHALWA